MLETDLVKCCGYCDVEFATIDEANMHEREHPAYFRRRFDARQHFEEWDRPRRYDVMRRIGAASAQ